MNWEVVLPLLVFLAVIFFIGFYASARMKTASDFLQEYFLGSRELGGFILAMTMTATYGSASSFVGGPGVAYTMGLGWVLLSMSQLATGYFVLSVLGKKFAIMARKIRAVTLIDFLKERYRSKWVVLIAAFSIIVFLFSAMAAQWVGGARLIETMTGLSYTTALALFAVSVLIYVIIGGFRAVAITDTVQGIVMFVGTVIILIGTIVAGGGVEAIINDLAQENPNLISPYGADGSLTPAYVSSFWVLVGIGVIGLPQVAVRAMSYKSSKGMHRALIIGTIVVGVIMLGMHLTGVFARAVLPGIEIGDTVMPRIAMEVLPPWLAGIVLAAPMAAIMSTVDSLLLLVSSAVVKDVYINYIKPDASDSTVKRISFGVTAMIGILVFAMAIQPPELLIWLNLFAFGGLEAAFIWPVVLGLYWKKGNASGALASMLTGVGSYIIIYSFWDNPFGMHTVILPVLTALVIYVLVSLLTGERHRRVQEEIIEKLWKV
ncbi:sodium/pantothenate symporter [Halobacillus sp. ACCC02827]|uniref:sodium/pantothenate symporter n=1 Tax=Bacillaceae TaxID=186817 RepID=UPI0002A4FC14|nr:MULTISPECIES: sodium/pantothenate symporter [Bacillaceae]ELK44924.1 sodium/panthothenate symporter [Halobacillus sp. BAB-2008]QHT47046.1 sodium/panthothenate symporter [Bacillus sp. SB49]WJE14271.1 sodium/pantothenate symporter [Halobacillus sp. ACCC02827]